MATQRVSSYTDAGSLNKYSVAALALVALAVLSLWFFGNSGLAILAVGAGHVALSQITIRGGRGRRLAIVALVVGYAIAALALFTMLTAIPAMIQQYNA
ncbi:DUF4190 domain-containing protein [Arthrobacter sp. JUb115]|uniref:DUF4190 domain-containing protein n=1 Tax=Arthrobacter sp. JUb115 TaxID=2485108 RepID=UPI001061039A|nr:DUF4190 domain-containing protein [Arthrobacter sp. JUb115]TDU25335.1 hypothetical protein EDF61_10664 [Arthrobacter sp. JUb115]